MRIHLPDGSSRELPDGATGADLAADIGPGLARAALAIRVLEDGAGRRDGSAYDGDGDALKLLRHDAAHVLAEAVLELYPGTKVSIGPPIADGFYYDFEFPEGVTVSEHDLPAIEAKMREHLK